MCWAWSQTLQCGEAVEEKKLIFSKKKGRNERRKKVGEKKGARQGIKKRGVDHEKKAVRSLLPE